jgi:lysophospholipase L1-like esterase
MPSFRSLATALPALFLGMSLRCLSAADVPTDAQTIPASDATFLGSVLDETWDVSHAVASGYIDGMMPASDVDLTVVIAPAHPGPVVLRFDPKAYPQDNQGPNWISEVDGTPCPPIINIGISRLAVSTPSLDPGTHRVRFIQTGNTSGSPRWAANDPELSRVTGVTLPPGATLQKSQRSASWFLPITDSIGEGYHNINATRQREGPGSYTDITQAWPTIVGRLMNKSIAGYMISGIGIAHAGTGTPYGALNAQDESGRNDPWDHIFEGVPRPFTTAPDFIILCIGSNEFATDAMVPGHASNVDPSSLDANMQANLEKFIARVRARPQLAKTPLLISVAFGGFKRTPMQAAVAAYKAAHPEEANLYVFDLAYGSPALTTTDGIDEVALFNGLTKNYPDDHDTIPSPQAPDRTHPYGIATPAIGSVDAQAQIAKIMAARLTTLLAGGPAPKTGSLTAGDVHVSVTAASATLTASRTTAGITTVDPAHANGATYRLVVTDTADSHAVSISAPVR